MNKYGLKNTNIGEFYLCNPDITGHDAQLVGLVLNKQIDSFNRIIIHYEKYYFMKSDGLDLEAITEVTEFERHFKEDFKKFNLKDKKNIFYLLFK